MNEGERSRNEESLPVEDPPDSPGSSVSSESSLAHIVTTGIKHPGKNGKTQLFFGAPIHFVANMLCGVHGKM